MATGDKIQLGGFYVDGILQKRADKPWANDREAVYLSGKGDMAQMTKFDDIQIKDSPVNPEYRIQWVEINENGKKYLVSDRLLIIGTSWNTYYNKLADGREIIIDGNVYRIRMLTGGGSSLKPSDKYSGGSPTTNEWDKWIVNNNSIPGLPIPSSTDKDSTQALSDLNGQHNKFWNWVGAYTITKGDENGNEVSARGGEAAQHWEGATYTTGYGSGGFRPVLEFVRESKITIDGPSKHLGSKVTNFTFSYSVIQVDKQSITSTVKINGNVIDTTTSSVGSIKNRNVEISKTVWDSLSNNDMHTIVISVSDVTGVTVTSSHTFTKVNAAPTAVIIEPKGDAVKVPIVDKNQPILVWSFKDVDIADMQSAYQVIVENIDGQIVHDSTKKIGSASYYQVPVNLEWTKTYKWKVTVWDRYDVPSNVSEYGFFKPNRAPNLTGITPGSTDKLLPVKVGTTPVYKWTFEDLDLEAQAGYQLQIYKTADDSIVYNTNRVSKNLQTHTVPDGVLLPGADYYAILTVWDPNDLFAKTDKLYIATNATPNAPILTRPIDNYRTTIKPTLSAVVGTDPENDKQHFKVQLSQDKDFATGVLEFTSASVRAGWKVDGFDIPVAGVDNSSAGKSVEYTLQANLDKNKTYYWRMAAVDNNTKAVGKYSDVRKIRVGNRIEYNTLKRQIPTNTTAARRILVALDYTLAKDGAVPSTIKVFVTNNALDVAPKWEDATTSFLRQDYYTFTNTVKTAAQFGVGVKVVIESNDSMEVIAINAAGITFD